MPGVGLLRLGRPRPVGVLLLATAATLVLAAVAVVVGHRDLATRAALAAALLLAPVALAVHPGAPLRHLVARPVDFLVLVSVVAAGTLATLLPETTVAMTLVVLMVLAAHVWWAIEHSDGRRRRALSLMALAAGAGSLAAGVLSFALPGPDGTVWGALPLAVVGPALYVGASGSSGSDVRALAIAVTSHGGALLALVATLIGLTAPLLDAGLGSAEIPVLALVAAALAPAYHPGQRALRGAVEELVLGHRDDPLAAVGLVSGRSTGDPVDSLRAVREALALPWAAVVDPGGAVVASSGERPGGHGLGGPGRRPGRARGRASATATWASRPVTAACSRWPPRSWPRHCGPVPWPATCRRPVRPASSPSRRSACDCGASCTTGSDRCSRASASPPTRPATWCVATPRRPRR